MSESLVLDPVEVAADRAEVDITDIVGEAGPEWGDAAIEAYMAQAHRGQVPVDYRVPNRQIQIPLTLGLRSAADFETNRAQVQAKAALFQREGGWLKRETSIGPLYADIVGATLKYGGGRLQAISAIDADAVLTLEAIPDWYGDENTLSDHTETTLPELVFPETGIGGDYPGRLRIVVDEDDGDSQLGLIWGIRSKHYDAAATARLAYEAEAMTALDTAAIATVSGASGGGSNNVVRHTNLATSWTPVLSTQAVSAGAHKTHKGTYRVWARVYSTSGDDVQLRFVWDAGDLALPVENAPKCLPPTGSQFYLVDLGEIRLDPSPTGSHRWQGVIQAKGDAGAENVSIDRVYFVPVDEGYGVLRAPVVADPGQVTYSARDEFNQTAGALTGKTLPVGGTWAGVGDSDDFTVEATGKTAQRTAVSDADNVGRVVTASTPNLAQVAVQVDVKGSAIGAAGMGIVARFVDVNNYFYARLNQGSTTFGQFQLSARVAASELGTQEIMVPFAVSTFYSIRVVIDAAGRFWVWLWKAGASLGDPMTSGQHPALATGGALATGKVGIHDVHNNVAANTRNYNNFTAWVPSLDAVFFPNQSAELRSDGMFREDSAGAAYGPVSHVIGDLPRLPPSGLEGRPVELFLKASRGDLDQLPDSGIDDLSAQVFYRPSWLFVPAA